MIVPKIAFGLAGFMLFIRFHLYGSLFGIVGAHAVLVLPFVTSIVSAGLVRVDPTLEEAAMDLGASRIRAFVSVGVPQLRQALIAAAMLSLVVSFDEVDATIMLVSPKLSTLPVEMYQYVSESPDPTLAALSTILIMSTLAMALAVFAILRGSNVAQLLLSSETSPRP
jgi:ABC-type spermidine/putrescine transport system permease subunit II